MAKLAVPGYPGKADHLCGVHTVQCTGPSMFPTLNTRGDTPLLPFSLPFFNVRGDLILLEHFSVLAKTVKIGTSLIPGLSHRASAVAIM